MADKGIQIEVYKDTNPTELVDVINARTQPAWLSELKNHGAGSFVVSKSDPKVKANPSLIDYRNFVRVRVNGRVVGGFIIQTKKTIIVGDGEAADESWFISGEGLRSWLKDASVYPAKGLKATSKETRFFNFASERGSWYNPSDWVPAVRYERWNSGSRMHRSAPADWPDAPNAWWIWDRTVNSGWAMPLGYVYFRHEFTTTDASSTRYALFFGVDDRADVYIDGELVMTTAEHAWEETNRLDFDLEPGPHVIALKAYNYRSDAPGGVIAALFRYGDPNAPTSARLVSTTGNSTWLICPYPQEEPGWTVGDILKTLINEAKTRGIRFANNITLTFNEEYDSAGLPWNTPSGWEFDVGASYSDVVETLEESECDVYLDPDTLQLYAWNKRGYDRSLEGDFENAIEFRPGRNLFTADETGQAAIANRILLRTPEGWVETSPQTADSESKYGRIETQIETDLTGASASSLIEEVFRQKALPEKSATFSVHVTDDMIPFVNYDVGDWVSAANDSGDMEPRRVVSISVGENPSTGDPLYTLEFDTIFKDRQAELEKAVNKATGGSSIIGGFPATAKLPSTVVQGNPPPPVLYAKQPDRPEWVSITSTGKWSSTGDAVADVALQWTPVTTSAGEEITDVEGYELWARRSSEELDQLVGVYPDTYATLSDVPSGTEWVYRVRAVARTNGEGLFSVDYPLTTALPVVPLGRPSAPSLETELGVVVATWDGLLGGQPAPSHFNRMILQRSEDETNWINISSFQRFSGQDASGIVGNSYSYRFVAVDNVGNESAPSDPSTIVVKGVQAGQIENGAVIADSIAENAVSVAQLANGAVTREKIRSGAVGTNEIADFALTAKKFYTDRHMLF